LAHGVKSRNLLAIQYGVSTSALGRHIVHTRANAGLALIGSEKAKQARRTPTGPAGGFAQQVHRGITQMLAGAHLAQEVGNLRARADRICAQAETTNDPRTALLAIRELTRLLELQGRMILDASQGRASDISSHPVWMTLAGLIMGAIGPCERCKPLVLQVIRERLGVQPEPQSVPFP